MQDMAKSRGYARKKKQKKYISFLFLMSLCGENPRGYRLVDGRTTPDFYLSNVHMFSFLYGNRLPKRGTGFHELRQMKHYRPELDLCVLDPDGKPVGMAIVWYDGSMPYASWSPWASYGGSAEKALPLRSSTKRRIE
jgi:hypothetical protein